MKKDKIKLYTAESKSSPEQIMKQYEIDGFKIIYNSEIKDKVANLRKKFISVFNTSSLANGSQEITNDEDICKLYIENKPAWIAAYDSIRLIPELYALAGSPIIIDALKTYGVVEPVVAKPSIAVRIDMPEGQGSTLFPPHQDYPYNKGSDNGIVVWIPLQDTDVKLGCLKFSPRSHEAGFIKGITPKVNNLEGMILSDDYEFEDAPMLEGEAMLFSMFLVHKSGVNSSKSSIRWSVQIRYNDIEDSDFAKRGFKPHENP